MCVSGTEIVYASTDAITGNDKENVVFDAIVNAGLSVSYPRIYIPYFEGGTP